MVAVVLWPWQAEPVTSEFQLAFGRIPDGFVLEIRPFLKEMSIKNRKNRETCKGCAGEGRIFVSTNNSDYNNDGDSDSNNDDNSNTIASDTVGALSNMTAGTEQRSGMPKVSIPRSN